jgi:hypothetical protein
MQHAIVLSESCIVQYCYPLTTPTTTPPNTTTLPPGPPIHGRQIFFRGGGGFVENPIIDGQFFFSRGGDPIPAPPARTHAHNLPPKPIFVPLEGQLSLQINACSAAFSNFEFGAIDS